MAGRRLQAAALPWRRTALGTLELLLVSKSGGGWGVPKGGIKRGADGPTTAQEESLEEAGVLGLLEPRALGRFGFRKRGRKHEVWVYSLEVQRVLPRWQEEGRRHRIWVPLAEATPLIRREELVPFLFRLRHTLVQAEALTAVRPQLLAA